MKQESTASMLPTTAKEMKALGWEEADIILFTGDAYVDHPSFGAALLGRLLQAEKYRVALVPQPNWQDDLRDFRKMGRPRLFFGVTAGAMDSMVNHYTAARRLRSDDPYTPGGKAGFRPDYPTVVYTRALKKHFPGVPVVVGGVEASMRRLAHYDYWSDEIKPSILLSSGADLLIYGMSEKPLLELAQLLERGVPFENLKNLNQTAIYWPNTQGPLPDFGYADQELPSYESCLRDKKSFARAFRIHEENTLEETPCRLLQKHGNGMVVVNPPHAPADTAEIDRYYNLPYTRKPHPRYRKKGTIPAWEMIRHSVTLHRGCFGGCSFCAISAHQGNTIRSRSEASVLEELKSIASAQEFPGVITDLGGPSANMYGMGPLNAGICRSCKRPSCIHPGICPNLNTSHGKLNRLYQKAARIPGIKKVFIGSGLRYDLLDPAHNKRAGKEEREYLEQLIRKHTSGRLKVAPEHTSGKVLEIMRKPSFELFQRFALTFRSILKNHKIQRELIPYFISSHPGCTEEDMYRLAETTRTMGLTPEQVQDFTPTPMTLSTVMFYTGIDPYTMKPVFVARDPKTKKEQNRYFFWYKQENRKWFDTKKKRYHNKQQR